MVLHGNAVAHRQRQRAAGAAFTQHDAHHGDGKARHGNQVVGDGVALPALLGLHAAERTLRVYQAHDGTAELLGLAHQAQALAVALRLRAAEVAGNALLQVGALFLGDDGNGHAIDPADAADDGAIVGEAAVAVELEEALYHMVDVELRGGPVDVAGHHHAFPCRVLVGRAGLLHGKH